MTRTYINYIWLSDPGTACKRAHFQCLPVYWQKALISVFHLSPWTQKLKNSRHGLIKKNMLPFSLLNDTKILWPLPATTVCIAAEKKCQQFKIYGQSLNVPSSPWCCILLLVLKKTNHLAGLLLNSKHGERALHHYLWQLNNLNTRLLNLREGSIPHSLFFIRKKQGLLPMSNIYQYQRLIIRKGKGVEEEESCYRWAIYTNIEGSSAHHWERKRCGRGRESPMMGTRWATVIRQFCV